ncbi:MAG TPA: sugar ABC transporter ATP-binding protein [Anaeromyxobacteraceae bacterium]|nr:sugar ABC transporter ATP-binding protein [Anaeromyxobacteraceae bacterium]
MSADALLALQDVDKWFAGVHALNRVSLAIRRGEIHCLAGENGSGKSTLIKVIAGVVRPDAGTIAIDGSVRPRLHPIDAIRAGIQVIYQDFSLFPNLTVAENLALNTELDERRKLVRWSEVRAIARRALEQIDVLMDLDQRVERLPVADKQLVAIARALLHDARLVILDEPTTALTGREVKRLFEIIKRMQAKGISALFVSHKLREVLEISERITILRNGQKVAEGEVARFDERKIVQFMTGREISGERFSYQPAGRRRLLEVSGLGYRDKFHGVDLVLHEGEILGITGLLGSGRTELALSLFGLRPHDRGTIRVDGVEQRIDSIPRAIRAGIAYVPEDRVSEGLFLSQSIARNVSVSVLDRLRGRGGLVDFGRVRELVQRWVKALAIATPDAELPVQSLSGGNQQRVVLARWLSTQARVLVLNGPTVGVDIGSKADIHTKLKELAAGGLGIIVISDDLPELVQNCNRVLVMEKGRVVTSLEGDALTEASLTQALGGNGARAAGA